MYDQFYNLRSEPFRLSPDHAFAYSHKGYVKARAYMAYAFMRAEGFVMVTGRPGTGKTTLIGALVDHLAGEDVSVANLVCTQLQADDLLKLVAYEFGISVNVVHKGELLQHLTQQFKSWHRDGRRALLIVDEAQDLSVSAMEELRLLTNIQIDGIPLLQIFLLGQPELRELILSPALEQVHQRIVAASHLRALEVDETEAYIVHRLDVVGWRGDPAIQKAVYPLIHKYSEGIPRRINLICSRLFLQCAVEQRHVVELEDLREVLRELQEENLAAGTSYSEADFALAQNAAEESPTPFPERSHEIEGGPAQETATIPATPWEGGATDDGPPGPAMNAIAGDELAVEANQKPQRLKVIGGSTFRVSALKTGTSDEELEGFHEQPAESDVGIRVDQQREWSAPLPLRPQHASSLHIENDAPVQFAAESREDPVLSNPESRVEVPPTDGPAAGGWSKAGSVEVLVILAVSIGLVVWAVTGFGL